MTGQQRQAQIHAPSALAHLGEAAALLRRERVLTATVILVVLAMVTGILTSAGRSDAAASAILDRIDTASARSVVIADPSAQAGLSGDSVAALQALSGIDWVLGLGPAQDLRNAAVPSGDPVPMRAVSGDIGAALGLDLEQLPDGAALASSAGAARLGLSQGVGAARTAEQSEVVIAGTYTPPGWLDPLRESVILSAPNPPGTLAFIIVLATSIETVPQLITAARAVIVAEDPNLVSVVGSTVLADLEQVVSGDLASYTQAIVLGVLGLGAFATAVALLGLLGLRNVDFGRRRALGASRGQLIGLTLLHILLAGILGAVAGVAVSLIGLALLLDSLPSPGFILGTAGLSILTAVVAATPPALRAAAQDPVAVLRTP